jgi:nitrogen regulatory protein PII
MKRIEAIIKPFKLEEVINAVKEVGIQGMTIMEVKGSGMASEIYRGSEYAVHILPKMMIIIYAPDEQVTTAVEAIAKAARTGKIGDGRIAVTDIIEVLRIRTGERGENAI